MSAPDSGGPAFPTTQENYCTKYSDTGMALRTYLAAHAPVTMADATGYFYTSTGRNPRLLEVWRTLAQMRAEYADAMIEELSK